MLGSARVCEECTEKHASFGLSTDRKIRWCGACGKAHGAVNLGAKMCETCGVRTQAVLQLLVISRTFLTDCLCLQDKQANFGHKNEGDGRRKRWCMGCGVSSQAIWFLLVIFGSILTACL